MSRKNREQSGRQALAAHLSAQFDRALSEAAEAMDSFGPAWDDSGPDDAFEEDLVGDLLPLEFQLADLERAVDTILEERDRFLYGYPGGEEAVSSTTSPAAMSASPRRR